MLSAGLTTPAAAIGASSTVPPVPTVESPSPDLTEPVLEQGTAGVEAVTNQVEDVASTASEAVTGVVEGAVGAAETSVVETADSVMDSGEGVIESGRSPPAVPIGQPAPNLSNTAPALPAAGSSPPGTEPQSETDVGSAPVNGSPTSLGRIPGSPQPLQQGLAMLMSQSIFTDEAVDHRVAVGADAPTETVTASRSPWRAVERFLLGLLPPRIVEILLSPLLVAEMVIEAMAGSLAATAPGAVLATCVFIVVEFRRRDEGLESEARLT